MIFPPRRRRSLTSCSALLYSPRLLVASFLASGVLAGGLVKGACGMVAVGGAGGTWGGPGTGMRGRNPSAPVVSSGLLVPSPVLVSELPGVAFASTGLSPEPAGGILLAPASAVEGGLSVVVVGLPVFLR